MGRRTQAQQTTPEATPKKRRAPDDYDNARKLEVKLAKLDEKRATLIRDAGPAVYEMVQQKMAAAARKAEAEQAASAPTLADEDSE